MCKTRLMLQTALTSCLTLLYLTQIISQEVHDELSRREVLERTLNTSRYDPRIPPDYERDVATNVTLQLHILSFDSINEASMDYSINIYLREKWTDPRLSFMNYTKSDWLELDTRMLDQVWVPDVYFQNEKQATFHNVTVPNRLIHLHRNGTVNYSLRLSMTLSCHMNLDRYPMDTQNCPIIIQSYAYSTDNVVFAWAGHNPVTTNQNLELPQFNYQNHEIVECHDLQERKLYKTGLSYFAVPLSEAPYGGYNMSCFVSHPISAGDSHVSQRTSERFACIMATFKLKRDMGYFVLQVYLPSILIVILSWISFWIDVGAVPARISLGVLTVLTMTTQSAGAQTSLPRVSYVKAIDVWMSTCLFFVFSALLEYAYVNVSSRRYQRRPRLQKRSTLDGKSQTVVCTAEAGVELSLEPSAKKPKVSAQQLDKFSRVVFPLAFIIFNVIYWCIYLNMDE